MSSVRCVLAVARKTETAFLNKLCAELNPRVRIVATVDSVADLESAIEQAEVDSVLLDSELDGESALTSLLHHLQSVPRAPAVLLLSDSAETEFLNEMMLLGVRSVLARPVSRERLEHVLQTLFAGRGREHCVPRRESIGDRMRTFIERELVSLLITGEADADRIDCYFRFLGLSVSGAYFLLLSRGKHPADSRGGNVMEVAERYLAEQQGCLVGNSYGSKVIALFPTQGSIAVEQAAQEGLGFARRLQARIRKETGLEVPIGVGSLVSDVGRLNEAYNEAFYALYLAERDNSVVHYSWLWSYNLQQKEPEYPHELENTFLTELRQGNTALLYELTDELISCILTHCERIGTMKEWAAEFVTILKRETAITGLQINLCHHGGKLLELHNLQTVEELRIWFRKAVLSIVDNMNQNLLHDSRDPLARVFTIIDKPFDRAITLESTAAKVGLSPQYLSRIFKDRYKTKFIDYLTHRRISYAKELLKDRRLTMREIAEKVGYGDANYFTRVFRKQTGVSPRQFRDRQ